MNALVLSLDAFAQDSNQVWQAQRCLTALGYYTGVIDGVAGTGSRSAILRFQQAAGVAPTAALDSRTRAALQAVDGLGGPTVGLVAEGSAAVNIAEAQRILFRLGYDPGQVDGSFGPATSRALAAFQQASGLSASATLDEATMADLRSRETELGTVDAVAESDGELRFLEVFETQMLLSQLGFADLVPDGQIGPSTASALGAFQITEGIDETGELTRETLERLRRRAPLEDACLALTMHDVELWLALLGYDVGAGSAPIERFQRDEALVSTGVLTPETYDALRQRVSGLADIPPENPFVVEVQLRLAAAGFDVGSIDGVAGLQFETALRAFQQAHGLPAIGRIDNQTLAKLRAEGRQVAAIDTRQLSFDYIFEVSEDAANGTLVGSVVAAGSIRDADVTAVLVESSGGRFAFEEQSGGIFVADSSQLDYDRDQSHRLLVQLTDGAGATGLGTVSVTITEKPGPHYSDTYEEAIHELQPVGYWRLDAMADGVVDEGGGYGESAADGVGDHPGTYNGGTDTDTDGPFTGISTGTTQFDGEDEFVRVTEASNFMPANGTFVLWLAADKTDGDTSLIHYAAGSESLDLSVRDGRLRLAFGTIAVQTIDVVIAVGQWHNVAASWGDAGIRLHLDGTLVATDGGEVGATEGLQDLVIAAAEDGSRTFAGRISEVALFDAILSIDQLNELIDKGVNGKDVIVGTSDADTLRGVNGEVIHGMDGNDNISGSPGGDIVFAGKGDDIIDGNQGNDTLFGGDGHDVFLVEPNGGTDEAYGGTDGSVDTIRVGDVQLGPNAGAWAYELTNGAVTDEGTDHASFTMNAAGYVELADRTRMEFQHIERIEW